MNIPSLVRFGDPRCQDPRIVGNKAANLAVLATLGYRVPDGFCITTDAAREIRSDPNVLTTAEWISVLEDALAGLRPPWAVRSSSTAEDSAGLAFAGVFRTKIGVSSTSGVIDAIRAVIASMNEPEALRYTAAHKMSIQDVAMAVIVQTLVPATYAGVAFSRDPVTGGRVIVIEANYGLADTVVDGSVTPDTIEVGEDGDSSVIRIGTKRVKTILTSAGLVRVGTSEAEQRVVTLSPQMARGLAHIVKKIESDLGSPQDVEWGISGEETFILQSRPITTAITSN